MDRIAVFDKVCELVQETLELDEDVELRDDSAFKDLGADSFDLLELVNALEEEFDMEFDDEALTRIQTIGDAVDGLLEAQTN